MTDGGQNKIRAFGFVAAVTICFFVSSWFAVSSLSGFRQACGIRLEERINPNNAPVVSLARLPGIGDGRAKAIVDYRTSFAEKEGKGLAFEDSNDLLKVKGIGVKTVQSISEWLKFE